MNNDPPRKRLTPLQTIALLSPILASLDFTKDRANPILTDATEPSFPIGRRQSQERHIAFPIRSPREPEAPRPPNERQIRAQEKRDRKAAILRRLTDRGAIKGAT